MKARAAATSAAVLRQPTPDARRRKSIEAASFCARLAATASVIATGTEPPVVVNFARHLTSVFRDSGVTEYRQRPSRSKPVAWTAATASARLVALASVGKLHSEAIHLTFLRSAACSRKQWDIIDAPDL